MNEISSPMMIALILLALIIVALIYLLQAQKKADIAKTELQAELLQNTQNELARLHQTTEAMAARQSELSGRLQQSQTGLNDRLDNLGKRLGDGLMASAEKTGSNLKNLENRLAVIDRAQQNIMALSENMVSLQDILSNKQARGAFGEVQMQDLVRAALPPDSYGFQVTLSNGKRADCLLKLPNPPGAIAIDSKFPLESFQALKSADNDATKTAAIRQFSTDVIKHIRDIHGRYIIPGETAESAVMFLPSESIYAELHENFRNVIEQSFKLRVWIVSPATLMATLNTVRAVLKDARMREQAGVIQTEVGKLLEDITRLDKRVGNLQSHFDQATRDIRDIRVSTEKISKRGHKIDSLQFSDDGPDQDLEPPLTTPKQIDQDG